MILLALASYIAGGIPSGYLLARRLRGIDIREHGSGNPGAANVYRVVGPAAGLACLLLDALKGFLPVLLARRLYPDGHIVQILCGGMAVVGHVWTVFLGLRGGKGVATSAGVFAALLPQAMAPTAAVFLLAAWVSGHISVGSMAAAAAFPFLALAFGAPAPLIALAAGVSVLIWIKHIPNLRRLLGGKEPRIERESSLEKSGKRR